MTQTPQSPLATLIAWAEQNNIGEKYLPRNVEELKKLEVLKLHDLNLAQVPDEIGALENLRELYLSYNTLAQLPDTLGQLKNIEILWVQGNQLYTLPNSIKNLSRLKDLAAFDNNLVCLPADMERMPALENVFLHHNCLDEQACQKALAPLALEKLSLYEQKILPLDASTFAQALALRDRIFDHLDALEYDTLKTSLDLDAHLEWAKKIGIEKLNYWVSKEINTKEVQGIVGLYTNVGEAQNAWLGWYGVDPEARGRHVGSRLLDLAIAIARKQGYRELHLYTTTQEIYAKARAMYEKRGFRMYKTEKNGTLYYRHILDEKH